MQNVTIQCSGITQKGSRCLRKVHVNNLGVNPQVYCTVHTINHNNAIKNKIKIAKKENIKQQKPLTLNIPDYLKAIIPPDIIGLLPPNITIKELEEIFIPSQSEMLKMTSDNININSGTEIFHDINLDSSDELECQDHENVFECMCCFCESYVKDRVRCNKNGHEFCKDCLIKWVTAKITEGNSEIKCMSSGSGSACSGIFSLPLLKKILPKNLFETLQQKESQENVAMANILNLYTCPKCKLYSVIMEPEFLKKWNISKLECLNKDCKFASCLQCKGEFHGKISCVMSKADQNIRKIIEEMLSNYRIRHCPSCSNEFVRIDGCNKMTCTKCKKLSCYVCKKLVLGYDHFTDKSIAGKCKLYTNEIEIIKMSLIEAIKEIYNTYKSSPEKLKESYAILSQLEKSNQVLIDQIYINNKPTPTIIYKDAVFKDTVYKEKKPVIVQPKINMVVQKKTLLGGLYALFGKK
jgi:hypothetical protein